MAKQRSFLISGAIAGKYPALRRLSWLLEAAMVRALVGLIRILPAGAAMRVARAAFRLMTPILPFAKKIRRNLAVAFPDRTEREINRLTRSACANLGSNAVELVLASRIWEQREQRVEFVVEDGIDLESYTGRPAVFVTGHIGAWQISTFIGSRLGLDVTSVYAPAGNPYLDRDIVAMREQLPVTWLPRDGCMRYLMKELANGNAVGLVTDARLDSGEMIRFFGHETPSNTAAARLAVRYDCPLFPVRAERLGGLRFRITLYPPIRESNPEASADEKARDMTAQLFECFEQWIREEPDQWMCFGRRWPRAVYKDAVTLAGAD